MITMVALLRVLGPLQTYVDGQKELIIKPGLTVRETLINLGIKPEVVALVSINDELEDKDYIIKDGDIVKIMAVIGGG